MFTHIGNNVNIKSDRIIGVFDIDTASVGKGTKIFLNKMQQSGRIVNISADIPRTVILTVDEKSGVAEAFLSPVSPATLASRGGGTQR